MSSFLGFGFSVAASGRRQQKLSRLWSVFDGTQTRSYLDGTASTDAIAFGAGSTLNAQSGVSGFLGGTYTGAGLVTKSGSGTITFNVDSPGWSGGITINSGTVSLAAGRPQALGTGTVTVNSGTVLNLGGNTIANTIVNNGGTVNP